MNIRYFFGLSLVCLSISAGDKVAFPGHDTNFHAPQVRKILELPKGSWLENIAVRCDGSLLATRLDTPELYLIDPRSDNSSVLATFPGVAGASGIAEYKPDVFAVATGNSTVKGSYSIQIIDLSNGIGPDGKVIPKLLADVEGAEILNGLTFRAPNTLYSSDSFLGQVWSVDIDTGAVEVAVGQDPLFQPSEAIIYGINGLRWNDRSQSLFFTNSAQAILGQVPVGPHGFGPAEKVASASAVGMNTYDDFALGHYERNFFAATNADNTVNFVSQKGMEQFVLAGAVNSTELAGTTSAAFGRTPETRKKLYVTTCGGQVAPVNNNPATGITGAKIVELDFD